MALGKKKLAALLSSIFVSGGTAITLGVCLTDKSTTTGTVGDNPEEQKNKNELTSEEKKKILEQKSREAAEAAGKIKNAQTGSYGGSRPITRGLNKAYFKSKGWPENPVEAHRNMSVWCSSWTRWACPQWWIEFLEEFKDKMDENGNITVPNNLPEY